MHDAQDAHDDEPPARNDPRPGLARRALLLATACGALLVVAVVVDRVTVDRSAPDEAPSLSAPAESPAVPGKPAAPTSTIAGEWDGVVGWCEWSRLRAGMSVRDAGVTVGGAGAVVDEQGELGEPGHRVTLRWQGEAAGSHADARFADGMLVETTQTGLPVPLGGEGSCR